MHLVRSRGVSSARISKNERGPCCEKSDCLIIVHSCGPVSSKSEIFTPKRDHARKRVICMNIYTFAVILTDLRRVARSRADPRDSMARERISIDAIHLSIILPESCNVVFTFYSFLFFAKIPDPHRGSNDISPLSLSFFPSLYHIHKDYAQITTDNDYLRVLPQDRTILARAKKRRTRRGRYLPSNFALSRSLSGAADFTSVFTVESTLFFFLIHV